jgi:class 3 adenylate cyclase
MTVLVVDDTPDNLSLMNGLLKDLYRVKIAKSGQRALALATADDPPDLILLDIMMPEMDGYEVCRRLKADPRTADIPVIFLTAKTEVEDEKLGFTLGAVDYIAKPVSAPILLARVATHLTIRSAQEYLEEKNQFLEIVFSRYVSRRVFEQLKVTPINEFLRMERREVTVLFSDIRGFTLLGDRIPPEEIQETVNSFLETMVGCIEDQDGTIDKFLGDGVMAIFGAPLKQEDHARRALNAAVAMQKAHGAWMEERLAHGRHARPMGIGVATGEVVVGNIGTPSRMEFTVLGHTVNLASRLCAAAEEGEILTTEITRERAGLGMQQSGALPFKFRERGKQLFKNISEPVEVLAVVV